MTVQGDSRESDRKQFTEEITAKEKRKIEARRETDRGTWFGLGMFGLVGWSVAIPTVIGVAVGLWMDAVWPGPVSWTITMLLVGVAVGCINAWHWVKRESSDE